MPLLPDGALTRVSSESWPPSPSRFPPSLDDDGVSTDDDDLDIPSSHENPLTYFLTPATPKEEDLEFDFEFDAGIEDSNSPRGIVRSISPSTLDGLKRYKPRDKNKDCAILDDDDDDDEDYIRFRPQTPLPFGFEDFFDRPKQHSPITTSRSADSLLSPASFHVGSPRGRPAKRFAPPPRRALHGRTRSLTLQRRHSWREPSPDVWSIEEEPEKETMSEMGLSVEDLDAQKTQPIDIPAAKPKKKVRFLLPAQS